MAGYSFSAIYGMLVFLLGAKVTLIGRMDAAFYVTHYIKWFDGDKLTFTIDEVICIHGESLPSLSMERSLASLLAEKSYTNYEPPLPDYTNYVFHDCSVKHAMGG